MSIYEQFIEFVEKRDDQLYAHCPFHRDDTPSFTMNEETNEWYCHSCKRGGAEDEFIAAYFDVPKEVAKFAHNYFITKNAWPFPSEQEVAQYQTALRNRPNEITALHNFGITDEVIEKYKLGLENSRITIPVYSNTGYCVNIRKYLPPHKRDAGQTHGAKCINVKRLGAVRYYPYSAFTDSDDIYIVEGEKDCLVAISHGINAVTSTGGSQIPVDELMLFKDKNVYLMLDTDQVGQKNTKLYTQLLRNIAKAIFIVTLPCKDFTDYWMETHNSDLSELTVPFSEKVEEKVQTQDMTLYRSEFIENLDTWISLRNMSIIGAESHIYTIPSKMRVMCNNPKCTKRCPLSMAMSAPSISEITVEPRQVTEFIDAKDAARDYWARKQFGCNKIITETVESVNVQKILFQESASFIDGLDESSNENRYGLYLYTDSRLQPTAKYNFEACRVSNPRNQKTYYVIRSAENVNSTELSYDYETFEYFAKVAEESNNAVEMMQKHYDEWMAKLSIEGRLDLFGSVMLTYCSVTEIPWNYGLIKGWMDIICVGDTRTGKSQIAQRLIKEFGLGSYINGENSRNTGVIGGVQKIGDAWMITWGAIPMNDKGLLFIDEASGLEIEDVKNLSSTRSSGAVTINKVIKGEARARTRVIWITNPRSGKNINEYYWKGFGAFQEYIPVMEDQARYDLVITAAREDIEFLEGIDSVQMPNVARWRSLVNTAWNISSERIVFSHGFKTAMRETCRKLNEDYGGGPIVIGVSVHEKMLRMTCAMAMLCGSIKNGDLVVTEKHIQWADEWFRYTLEKPSLAYAAYVREKRRAEKRKRDNEVFIREQLELHPALRSLLVAANFRGNQVQEVLGLDRVDASKILSELLRRGLVVAGRNGTYVPDKLLIDVSREEDYF